MHKTGGFRRIIVSLSRGKTVFYSHRLPAGLSKPGIAGTTHTRPYLFAGYQDAQALSAKQPAGHGIDHTGICGATGIAF